MERGKEFLIVMVVYLLGIFMYTLPIVDDERPFGSVDAPVHFTSGHWMAQNDKIMSPIPYYMYNTLKRSTSSPNRYLSYPPQFNTNEGIFQKVTDDSFLINYLLVATISMLIIFSLFFLIRQLYGFWIGLATVIMFVFWQRWMFVYLWGQWPEIMAYSFIPLVMYSYYRYLDNNLIKYLILTIALLVAQYTYHPQGFLFSGVFIFSLTLFILIKKKMLPFKWKHAAVGSVGLIALIFLVAPTQFFITLGSLDIVQTKYSQSGWGDRDVSNVDWKINEPSRLLYWFKAEGYNGGLPQYFLEFGKMYNGYWILIFLIPGLLILALKRDNKSLLLLSGLFGLYIVTHIDVFGFLRAHRFLVYEAVIFYPIAAIGAVGIGRTIERNVGFKGAKLGFLVILVLMMVGLTGGQTYGQLQDAYPGLSRINEYQMEAAEWVSKNLPEDAELMSVGGVDGARKKWFRGLATRNLVYSFSKFFPTDSRTINISTHIMIDYSDLTLLGNKDAVEFLMAWEQAYLINESLLYNKNNIRIYELDKNNVQTIIEGMHKWQP